MDDKRPTNSETSMDRAKASKTMLELARQLHVVRSALCSFFQETESRCSVVVDERNALKQKMAEHHVRVDPKGVYRLLLAEERRLLDLSLCAASVLVFAHSPLLDAVDRVLDLGAPSDSGIQIGGELSDAMHALGSARRAMEEYAQLEGKSDE